MADQIKIGDWLGIGGGSDLVSYPKPIDPIEMLRTMALLTEGDRPLTDLGAKDDPEVTVYFKCSATLLGRIIKTLEERRAEAASGPR